MSLVMALTMFSGMGMEARAADHTWVCYTEMHMSALDGTPTPSEYVLRTGQTLEMINMSTANPVKFTLTYRANGSILLEVTYQIDTNSNNSNDAPTIGNDPSCSGYAKWKPSLSGTTCYLDAIIEAPVSPSSPAAPASPETPASPSTAGGAEG